MPLDETGGFSAGDLTLAIYDAVASPELWPQFVTALAATIGCDAVDLMLVDSASGDHIIGVYGGGDERTHREYRDHYMATDVRLPRLARKRPLQIYDDRELITPEEERRSPFHQELLPRIDLAHLIGTRFALPPPYLGSLACGQSAGRGPFRPEQLNQVSSLVPHLQRGLSLALRLRRLQDGEALLQGALDQLRAAILILTADRKVLLASAAAIDIVKADDGLTIRGDQLLAKAASSERMLATRVRQAALTGGAGTAPADLALLVERPSGLPPYRVELHPVPRQSALLRDHGRGSVMVLIADPTRQTPSRKDLLRVLYRLTPAEAAIADAFARGATLREYAEGRAVSVETVRCQMKQVLAKTGCRRQGDLIRLLTET
jgi:DNA-binding CsgD family transcriptional regulator